MQLFEYIDIMNTPYQIYTETVDTSDFFVKRHWHYYVEFIAIKKGSIHVEGENTSCVLNTGDLVLFPARAWHAMRCTKEIPSRYGVIKFDLNSINIPRAYLPTIRHLLEEKNNGNPIIIKNNQTLANHFLSSLEESIAIQDSKAFGYELTIFSHISSLLLEIVRLYEKDLVATAGKKSTQAESFFFSHILEYIDAHYAEPISVQDLAEKSNMCYSNFAKQFKQLYGRSCKEYMEYIRILKAEEMVLNSNFDLSYIAQETGFADASHFIRTYKKFKQETPKQVRLKNL